MPGLEEKRPIGGLNTGDEDRLLSAEETRYALNIRAASSATDNIGAVENIKGNTLVEYDLPDGNNICIGTYEDEENQTMFYFVWNSNQDHLILRYFPDSNTVTAIAKSSVLNFDRNNLINGVDLLGDFLFWNDNFNPPRYIDVSKAQNINKDLVVHLYWSQDAVEKWKTQQIEYKFVMVDENGDQVFSRDMGKIREDSLEEASRLAASRINIPNGSVQAEGCGPFVKVSFFGENRVDARVEIDPITQGATDEVLVVPQNYYTELTEANISVAHLGPRCEPTVTLGSDPLFPQNFIEGKTFQFATRYIYADKSKSTLSPYSKLALVSDQDGDAPIGTSNFFDIDFTDPILLTRSSLLDIQGVEILMREGNNGVWRSVKVIDQYEFGNETNVYRFYNNSTANAIDQTEATPLFDTTPLLAKTQASAKNRLFYGNTLEGYDKACVDAKVDVSYNDANDDLETFTIKGTIHIRNPYVDEAGSGNKLGAKFHQPIHNDGAGNVFGGFTTGLVINDYVSGDNLIRLGQSIPLGGFVAYLAGTDFYAVSKQRTFTANQSNGVANTNSNEKRKDLRDFMSGVKSSDADKAAAAAIGEQATSVWSEFEITNVPKGRYVLRMASHLTTEADLKSSNRSYQNTSTYVSKAYRGTGSSANERELEILVDGNVNDVKIEIADLSQPNTGIGSQVVYGYVVDRLEDSLENNSAALNDQRITGARVGFNTGAIVNNNVLGGLGNDFNNGLSYTDANGFFFMADEAGFDLQRLKIENVISGNADLTPSLFLPDGTIFSNIVSGVDSQLVIARASDDTKTQNTRTEISGDVKNATDSALGVSNVSVVVTNGDVAESDINGSYRVVVYQDTRRLNQGFSNLVEKVLFAQSPTGPTIENTTGIPFDITIGNGNFNSSNPFEIEDGLVSVKSGFLLNAFKRGGSYRFGIQYYDFANRSNAFDTNSSLEVLVPFYTQADPKTGVVPAAGTPKLSWEINHRPPAWATHYQWVRTRNQQLNYYLQWAIDDVVGVDSNNEATNLEQAVKIRLDIIASIASYATSNPDSQISFEPAVGWRVRFIKDEGRNFFNEYIDVKIIGVTEEGIEINNDSRLRNLKGGSIIEVYNPIFEEDSDIFYEFGECYEIGTDEEGNRLHKGQLQDQSEDAPATGEFSGGDAYYRSRNITPSEGGTLPTFVDDPSASDFFLSNSSSIGRIAIDSDTATQKRNNTVVRWGEKLIRNTDVNGLRSFNGLDALALPEEYGSVNKLILAENVLMAIHRSRWVALYVEEAILRKQDGTDDIIASTDVIGSFRALRGKYGTEHPESVDEHKGFIWSFDVNKGEVIRYASNGLEAISDRKTSNLFADLSRGILEDNSKFHIRVPAKYDSFNDEYILTVSNSIEEKPQVQTGGFVGVGSQAVSVSANVNTGLTLTAGSGGGTQQSEPSTIQTTIIEDILNPEKDESLSGGIPTTILRPGVTLAFSERIGRWTTYYSFIPEIHGRTGIQYLTLLNGQLWLHESNDTRNNFYGTQFSSELEIIANAEPGKVKVYDAVSLESSDVWSVDFAKTGKMETNIVSQRFVNKEGVFYAALPRDLNSPGFSDNREALLNGQRLRGHSMNVRLKNDNNEETVLFAVNILSIMSERSKK